MGITGKLFPFCNFRASCSITAPAVLMSSLWLNVLNAVFLYIIWFTTIEILNIELCDTHLWHFHIADDYYYNKPEWTI